MPCCLLLQSVPRLRVGIAADRDSIPVVRRGVDLVERDRGVGEWVDECASLAFGLGDCEVRAEQQILGAP